MKIGITGSKGVLGSEFLKILNKKTISKFNGRVEKIKDVEKWIHKNDFDVIYHFAAIVPTFKVNSNKKKSMQVNYVGTKNIVDSINKLSKKKIWFFYSSTSHVYNFSSIQHKEFHKPMPISYYGKTKLLAENYLLTNKSKIIPCVGRIFSFTSKKQHKSFIIPSILLKLKNSNKKVNFRNLDHDRDFLPIKHIVNAIKILSNKRPSGVFNICSGYKTNLQNLTLELNQKFKKQIIFSNNVESSILFGCNRKLAALGWKINKTIYSKLLLKNI
jgi:nucleoside-diphosphate-sugar epimerase|tara:strand:- start:122 stop:937 length:816 start_codon:yes stop_codon:yes gene_type:complete